MARSESKPFDAYHRWLGIPPEEQPPNHYRLLGVEKYESDLEVIDRAANRQTAYLHQLASGPHRKESQAILNQIAQARRCLLDPEAKAAYDRKLREAEETAGDKAAGAAAESKQPAAVPPLVQAPDPLLETVLGREAKQQPLARSWSDRLRDWRVLSAAAFVVVLVVFMLLLARGPKSTGSADNKPAGPPATAKVGAEAAAARSDTSLPQRDESEPVVLVPRSKDKDYFFGQELLEKPPRRKPPANQRSSNSSSGPAPASRAPPAAKASDWLAGLELLDDCSQLPSEPRYRLYRGDPAKLVQCRQGRLWLAKHSGAQRPELARWIWQGDRLLPGEAVSLQFSLGQRSAGQSIGLAISAGAITVVRAGRRNKDKLRVAGPNGKPVWIVAAPRSDQPMTLVVVRGSGDRLHELTWCLRGDGLNVGGSLEIANMGKQAQFGIVIKLARGKSAGGQWLDNLRHGRLKQPLQIKHRIKPH